MLDHVDEAMENGAAGFSTGLFYPTNAGGGHRRGRAYRGALLPATAASTPRICATRWKRCSTRSTRRWRPPAGPTSRVVISHHKCAAPEELGAHEGDAAEDRGRGETPAGRARRYPYAAGSTNLRADLVTDEYRIMITWSRPHPEMTRPRPRRHRQGMGRRHSRGGEAARSRRRDLFPDGRGRCAPRAELFRSP